MSAPAMGGPWPGHGPAELLRMLMAGRGPQRPGAGGREQGEDTGEHGWPGGRRFDGFPFGGPPGHSGHGGPFGPGGHGGDPRGHGGDPRGHGGPGGHSGPRGPFGPGGPFGPLGRGGPFGDLRHWARQAWSPFGGPRARRGDVRAAALALLAERPMNGYQIIQEIKERSGGMWKPSSGAVYPALQQLEDEGLVQAGEHEGRRAFSLTEAGRTYVEEHPDELAAPWEQRFDRTAGEHAMELRELAGQTIGAFMQVALAGTPQQIEQAKQVISDARKALYRILAEDEPADGES